MVDYAERVETVYTALKESGDVAEEDVAALTVAVLQEEAKDRRTEMIDRQRNRARQTKITETQESGDQDTEKQTQAQTQKSQQGRNDWRTDPATDAQKKALENMGVQFDPSLTKGKASQLIDQAKSQSAEA